MVGIITVYCALNRHLSIMRKDLCGFEETVVHFVVVYTEYSSIWRVWDGYVGFIRSTSLIWWGILKDQIGFVKNKLLFSG